MENTGTWVLDSDFQVLSLKLDFGTFWVNLSTSLSFRIPPVKWSQCIGLFRMQSDKNVDVNVLWSGGSSHPNQNPASEKQLPSPGWVQCRIQDLQTEGQAQGWGACWPPAFLLSFSIMLIWLLLVTAIPHYYYSLQALNHSDGYNLTSTNLPNSSPLHFFNTKGKVGSFSNWLCNFLFSSTPASTGDAEKASFKRLLCGEIHWLVPVWPQSRAEWPWLCCILDSQLPGLVVGQSFIPLPVLSPAQLGLTAVLAALNSCTFRYGLKVGTLVP